MAGLPWIKVWTVIGAHPKVQRLEKVLGVRDALGVVVRLWCWTAEYHPGGDIPGDDIDAAARVARGDVTRRDVIAAMCEVGFLDATPSGYRVHDWADMQTRHVEAEEKRKAQARERQRRHRTRTGGGRRPMTVTLPYPTMATGFFVVGRQPVGDPYDHYSPSPYDPSTVTARPKGPQRVRANARTSKHHSLLEDPRVIVARPLRQCQSPKGHIFQCR